MSMGGVKTSLLVRRWDEDQTRYAIRRLGLDPAARNHQVLPGEFRKMRLDPYSVTLDEDCNMLVQAGWVALLGGIAGTSIVNKFSASFGRIGVGTSSTAAAYADTKLGGDTGGASTTSYYQLVSGAPTIATGSTPPTLTFNATFGTAVANFAWNEFGCDNYTASGVTTQSLSNVIMINHGISSQGTKAGGQTWTATVTISFGFPSGSGTVS